METKLAEVPINLFYPFYPDGAQLQQRSASASTMSSSAAANVAAVAASATDPNGNSGGDYTQLLAQAAAAAHQPAGPWGASGPESYMLEEKDVAVPMSSAMSMWMPDQRTLRGYVMGT